MLYILLIIIGLAIILTIMAFRALMKKNVKVKAIEKLEKEGKTDQAISEYENIVKDRYNERLLWRLATLYEKAGKYPYAISKLNTIIQRNKYSMDVTEFAVRKKYGELLFHENRDEEAFDNFIYLANKVPNDEENLLYLTKIAIGIQEFRSAYTIAKTLANNNPTLYEAHLLQGLSAYMNRDSHRAKDCFSKALDLNGSKNDWKVKFLYSVSCYMIKDYKNAYDAMLELSPNMLSLEALIIMYKVLGMSAIHLGLYKKALKQFKEAFAEIKNKDENDFESQAEFNFDIVISNCFLNQYKEALNEANTLIQLDKKGIFESNKLVNLIKPLAENGNGNNNINKGHLSSVQTSENPANAEAEAVEEKFYCLQDYQQLMKSYSPNSDKVYRLSGYKRLTQPFDIKKYLEGSIFVQKSDENFDWRSYPYCEKYNQLDVDSFISTTRKLIKKLDFDIIEENIRSKALLFSSSGEGIDYVAVQKGSEGNKFIIQVRRWDTQTIGVLVLKNLYDQIKVKNAQFGLFLTTGKLSNESMSFVESANNINIIQNKQLEFLLSNVMK